MSVIAISTDKNTVTVGATIHRFHPDIIDCGQCSLFRECCALQNTVENEFPFPCVQENRPDGQYGNFQLLDPA